MTKIDTEGDLQQHNIKPRWVNFKKHGKSGASQGEKR